MSNSQNGENEAYAWPNRIDHIPPDEDIVLLFHGLMCLCYNNNGFCEVGIHNQAPSHKFGIFIYEGELAFNSSLPPDQQAATLIYAFQMGLSDGTMTEPIRIFVNNPRPEGIGVKYYQQNVEQSPSGEDAPPYADRDFRWIVDFENELYKRQVKKNPETLIPSLNIMNGVFYVAERTRYWYLLKAQDDEKPARQIGRVIGANIYLSPDGYLALQVGSHEVRINATAGKKYYILVDNTCPRDVCKYDPTSAVKEMRNDFYLYYKTFEIPDGRYEYELKWDDKPRSSDDSPCGASGFGSGGCIHC